MKAKLNNRRLNINKTISTVIVLNIIQIVIIATMILKKYFYNIHTKAASKTIDNDMILLIIILIVCFNTFLFIKDFCKRWNNYRREYIPSV